jgi:uncharacterized protein (DUF1330 family)
MPKGYIIARVDVTNPDAYARYAAAATKAIADHGGKRLVRGGRYEALEGKARARNVVLEFESYDAAHRYFHSEQYQAARALREGAAFAKYGGRFLVRAGKHVVAKGAAKSRQVVIEFPDYATALGCLESDEYKRAIEFRDAASLVDLVIAEGYDGAQPG